MVTPTPLTWTLRLKTQKTTILLHISPLSTFSSIKSALLAALQDTGLRSTTGDSVPLPTSADQITLGRPRNPLDPSRGFVLGEWEAGAQNHSEDEAGDNKSAGKGKGREKEKEVIKDCPKGAGLRDNAVLAFRWVGEGMWDGEGEEGRDLWGVRIASFEDSYGVEERGDFGQREEFEG